MGDLHQNGLPEWEEGSSHHVPSSLHTLEELIELLTLVIFTASGQNAAVTAPIMDFYGNSIPNKTVSFGDRSCFTVDDRTTSLLYCIQAILYSVSLFVFVGVLHPRSV